MAGATGGHDRLVSGYTTRGRAEELEQRMAAIEARLNERIDGLEREQSRLRELHLEHTRAWIQASLHVLTQSTSAAREAPAERPRLREAP